MSILKDYGSDLNKNINKETYDLYLIKNKK